MTNVSVGHDIQPTIFSPLNPQKQRVLQSINSIRPPGGFPTGNAEAIAASNVTTVTPGPSNNDLSAPNLGFDPTQYGWTYTGSQQAANVFGDVNPNMAVAFYQDPQYGTVGYYYETQNQYWNNQGVWSYPGYSTSVTSPISGFQSLLNSFTSNNNTTPPAQNPQPNNPPPNNATPPTTSPPTTPPNTTVSPDPFETALLGGLLGGNSNSGGLLGGNSNSGGGSAGYNYVPLATPSANVTSATGGSAYLVLGILLVAGVGGWYFYHKYFKHEEVKPRND